VNGKIRWLRSIVVRVGRRGSYLLFLAFLDLIYGWSLISIANPLLHHIDLGFSPVIWGIIWVVVGVVCLIEAFAILDRLAFTMAVLLKFLWGTTMLLSWALTTTNPLGWISGSVFLAFSAATAVISFWPEQRRFKIEDR
jgi:hypothetical protein